LDLNAFWKGFYGDVIFFIEFPLDGIIYDGAVIVLVEGI